MEKRFVFLLGGACVGTGLATAACSDGFGLADKDGKKITESHGDGEESALGATESYDQLGYDGLDNLHWDGLAFLSLLLFFGGVGILVSANRNIWKQTKGY